MKKFDVLDWLGALLIIASLACALAMGAGLVLVDGAPVLMVASFWFGALALGILVGALIFRRR